MPPCLARADTRHYARTANARTESLPLARSLAVTHAHSYHARTHDCHPCVCTIYIFTLYTRKTVNFLKRGRAHTGVQQQKGEEGTWADVRPMHSHADLLQKARVHQCVCVRAPAHAHGLAACLTPLCACMYARQARSLPVDTQTKPTTQH